MKRFLGFVASLACAASPLSGCSSGNATGGPSATVASAPQKANGPITDAEDSGLKPVAGAKAATGDPKHGAEIFSANCASCHGQAGAGGFGPSLKGESKRKNYQAAIVWIENPKAPMPKLYPAPLSESDVQDVAAYVETL